MHLQFSEQYLLILNQLWESRGRDFTLAAWHGYGIRACARKHCVSVFVEPSSDSGPILDKISTLLPGVPTEAMHIPHFHQMHTGKHHVLSATLQPGNLVFASSPYCPITCVGTIGAFLTASSKKHSKRTWLLSNHHILAECTQDVEVRGANNVFIGSKVSAVPLQLKNNLVDAALAEIKDIHGLNATYPGVGKISRRPGKLKFGSAVRKLGNATGVTLGSFMWYCPNITVFDCTDTTPREFKNQLMFASKGQKKFADEGDSGSLVVSKGQPIGLLFAKTVKLESRGKGHPNFTPPFFLANTWAEVLSELSKVVNVPLKLVLGRPKRRSRHHTRPKKLA